MAVLSGRILILWHIKPASMKMASTAIWLSVDRNTVIAVSDYFGGITVATPSVTTSPFWFVTYCLTLTM